MGEQAVVVEDLHKRFGAVPAVAGVSFTVPYGSVLGLLGPNGAGKTTTIRILTTTLRADSGTARVAGHDVAAEPHAVRVKIGLAGQQATVDGDLTGRENLRVIGWLTHMPRRLVRQRIDDVLDQFGLTEASGRLVRTYSGGMRRRLDLAAALLHRPRIVFLDEPTTGLDPRSRRDLWDAIREMVDDGSAVLLTTQYLEEADRLADEVVVIDDGRVIASGTPGSLKAAVGATVLTVEVDAASERERVVQALSRAFPEVTAVRACAVEVSVGDRRDVLATSVRALDAAGVQPRSMQLREPTLEDVFLAVTGRRGQAAVEDGDRS